MMLLAIVALVLNGVIIIRYHRVRRITAGLLKFDTMYPSLLQGFFFNKDSERALVSLIEALMKQITRTFQGQIARSAVFVPNPIDPDYLIPIYLHQVPEKHDLHGFYIGENKLVVRGLAGSAYFNNETQIGHIYQKPNGGWSCDNTNYIRFEDDEVQPPYESIIAIPISDAKYCRGVICFDGKIRTVFDSKETLDLFVFLANRFATALIIHQQLQRSTKYPKKALPDFLE